jgi:hypothetical protein
MHKLFFISLFSSLLFSCELKTTHDIYETNKMLDEEIRKTDSVLKAAELADTLRRDTPRIEKFR